MVQLGRFLPLLGPVLGPLSYHANLEKPSTNDGIKKVHNLSKKSVRLTDQFNKMVDVVNIFRKISMDKLLSEEFNKMFRGSGITLINNWMKDIEKVTRSLEYRGISLKGTTRKNISREGGFLNFLRLLMAAGLSLMKSVVTLLAQSVLVPLRLTVAESATNEEMEDIIKIIKPLGESVLLIKGLSETTRNETKELKGRVPGMLVGTLLGNMLQDKRWCWS